MQTLKKFDTNSDRWFSGEIDQMKRIHKVYQDSLYKPSAAASMVKKQPDKKEHSNQKVDGVADAEPFLPPNSCLRSEKGELARPANCPFKDFSGFVASTAMDYWSPYFSTSPAATQHDRVLREIAEAVVSHICSAQSCKELRVRHGSKPLGRFWRAKREHITPLALTMHELKLWAATELRNYNIMEEDAYLVLGRRIKYVQGLARAQVWGPATGVLHQGMRPVAHDKLFRLLLTTREDLVRAKDYAFRGFCRRRSREKLARLGNLLKNVWFTQARALSAYTSIETALEDAKSPRLQPTDLFNQAHNQTFVDYRNAGNLLLKCLCDEELVRAGLLSDYASFLSGPGPESTLENWSAHDPFTNVPLDELYKRQVDALGASLPPAQAKHLMTAAKWRAGMEKALGSAADASAHVDAARRVLSALYALVPCMYAVHELYGVSGDGGDYTVFDTLRWEVIKVMEDCALRLAECGDAMAALGKLVERLRVSCEDQMEQKRLKTRKPEPEPVWVLNSRFVEAEFLTACTTSCAEAKRQAGEIARDAFDYSLTKEMLDERVTRCRRTAAALAKGRPHALSSALAASTSGTWPVVFRGMEDSDTRLFAAENAAADSDLDDVHRALQNDHSNGDAVGGGLGGHDEAEEGDDDVVEQAGGGNPFASSASEENTNPFA